MNNLALPEIPISGPVVSAADRIDRTGEKLGQATNAISDVLAQQDMNAVQVQAQEASLQATKTINDTLHAIRSTPYMKPEQVKALFGGNVPETVRLTKKVVGANGQEEEVDRDVIATHEFAPLLFERQAKAAVENAGQAITEAPWRQKWQQAVATDVEKARAEALDWQRAQRSADIQVQSVSQFHQYVAQRAWAEATFAASNPELDVKTRTELLASIPGLKTRANVEDRLRMAQTPEDLDKLRADIDGNSFKDAPLGADDQFKYAAMTHARKREMQAEQEHAEKVAYEKSVETEFDKVQQAMTVASQTGQPLSRFYSIANIPLSFKRAEFENLVSFIESHSTLKDRETDMAVYGELSRMEQSKDLAKIPLATMLGTYIPRLSKADGTKWLDRWAAVKNGGAPQVDEATNGVITRVLKDLKYDPEKKPEEWNTAFARAQRGYLAWREKHPSDPYLYDVARVDLTNRVFNAQNDPMLGKGSSPGFEREYFKDAGAANALSLGILAANDGRPASSLDIQEQIKLMEEEKPLVARAWADLNPNPETPLTEKDRAVVRARMMNPVERDKLDAQLKPNQRGSPLAQVYVAVANLQPPQNRERALKLVEERVAEAQRRQVVAAGKADKAQREAIIAADAAGAKQMTAAEKAAFEKLPAWEQRAVVNSQAEFEFQEGFRRDQIHARVYAEDYAAQKAAVASGKMPFTIGNRFPDDPVRIEMDKRVAAEAVAGRAERKADFDARQRLARDAYRKYYEEKMVNEDGSTKLIAPPDFLDFGAWVQQNRGPSYYTPPAVAGSR